MSLARSAKISIDLEALQHNFQQIKKTSPNSKIMPVIKANAYGHGMLQVAECLEAADGFAVAQLSEAIVLREAGCRKPISVFHGFSDERQLLQMLHYQIRPAISQPAQLDLLQSLAHDTPIDIWLKINTGMGRLGIQPDEAERYWQRIQKIRCIRDAGLMMHFANAGLPENASNQQQINVFQQLQDKLGAEQISVSNSAAIMSGLHAQQAQQTLQAQQTWLRPGIMLYGASPLSNHSAQALGLQPVMCVEAKLIAINQLEKGQSVGYGGEWTCPENMPVGIVNMGYGDGYPRHAASGTPVAIKGQLTQLIGRVSMDSVAVDLRGMDTHCGDSVELWGKTVAVDEVARNASTIAYELLCSAGRLVL